MPIDCNKPTKSRPFRKTTLGNTHSQILLPPFRSTCGHEPQRMCLHSFPRAAVTNYRKLCGLKQQNLFIQWSQRPEVWNQGLNLISMSEWSSLKELGDNLSLPLSDSNGILECGSKILIFVSVNTWHSPVFLFLLLGLYNDTCHWAQGLPGWSRMILSLRSCLQRPSSQVRSFSSWGLGEGLPFNSLYSLKLPESPCSKQVQLCQYWKEKKKKKQPEFPESILKLSKVMIHKSQSWAYTQTKLQF